MTCADISYEGYSYSPPSEDKGVVSRNLRTFVDGVPRKF